MTTRNKDSFLQAQPDKWLKYVLLDNFGLSSMQYLESTIKRYSWKHRYSAVNEIRHSLISAISNRTASFYVVKFVPLRYQFMLPNFRIHQIEDLGALEARLSTNAGEYAELWFCRTDIRFDQFSVGGRILIDIRSGLESQSIEQVWRCSPRLIETYNTEFAYGYVRAVRPDWGWRPSIVSSHIPKGTEITAEQLRDDFYHSMGLLSRSNARLIFFCQYLESLGNSVYSLEYKIEGSRVRIIDWDTQHDRRVLSNWFTGKD